MNDHYGDAVGGAVMGIMVRTLVVAVVKILHCAVCSVQCAACSVQYYETFPIYELFKAA